jgi:hypothetical protein
MLGSNLGEDTDYSSFSSVLSGKFWDNTSEKTRLLPSTSYPIHYTIRRCGYAF